MPTFIKQLELKNFLSFGPDSPAMEFGPLNVIIGANGSGKSNLLAGMDLLRRLPGGLDAAMMAAGELDSLVWNRVAAPVRLRQVFHGHAAQEFDYQFEFNVLQASTLQMAALSSERIAATYADSSTGPAWSEEQQTHTFSRSQPIELFDNTKPQPVRLFGYPEEVRPIGTTEIRDADSFRTGETVLTQIRDARKYPHIGEIAECLAAPRLYRGWTFGPNSPHRVFQRTGQPALQVEEDWSNYFLVVNRLASDPATKFKILKLLDSLAPGISDFGLDLLGSNSLLYMHEGSSKVSPSRMSDGTLRAFGLIAVLCQTPPPPLIVLEEPELGLHPDLIPTLADLLREAATRTQVIVTTHSDILVDCFTTTPEVVLVCEKRNGQTHIKRAKPSKVVDEGLGVQWLRGRIGGKRW